jgi:hypothetical protein
MIKQIGYLGTAGFLIFASVGFAQPQYQMALTGTYNQDNWGGAYVSPYTGTITGNGINYSGDIICDDYTTDVDIGDTWTATAENTTGVNTQVKFTAGYSNYSEQQTYDAAAWLANQLLAPASLDNGTVQADYSYAIWNIFDPGLTTLNGQNGYGPDGGALALINEAFAQVTGGYVANNVTVYTPCEASLGNCGAGITTNSQEYLVVRGAVQTPEPAAASVLGFDLLSVLAILFLLRRYRVRA